MKKNVNPPSHGGNRHSAARLVRLSMRPQSLTNPGGGMTMKGERSRDKLKATADDPARHTDAEWRAHFDEMDRIKAALCNHDTAVFHALLQLIAESAAFRELLRSLLKRQRKNGPSLAMCMTVIDCAKLLKESANFEHKPSPTVKQLESEISRICGLTEGQVKNILYPPKPGYARRRTR